MDGGVNAPVLIPRWDPHSLPATLCGSHLGICVVLFVEAPQHHLIDHDRRDLANGVQFRPRLVSRPEPAQAVGIKDAAFQRAPIEQQGLPPGLQIGAQVAFMVGSESKARPSNWLRNGSRL